MPVLDALDWGSNNKQSNNGYIYAKGMIVGNKVFNDYSVVSSDKNKQLVDVNEIYYFNTDSSSSAEYHRLDCPKLVKESRSFRI